MRTMSPVAILVVIEQLRRIEALEARLAQLRQEVDVIRGQQPPATIDEEHQLEEPFEHAVESSVVVAALAKYRRLPEHVKRMLEGGGYVGRQDR
jgi:hypothetical protein